MGTMQCFLSREETVRVCVCLCRCMVMCAFVCKVCEAVFECLRQKTLGFLECVCVCVCLYLCEVCSQRDFVDHSSGFGLTSILKLRQSG